MSFIGTIKPEQAKGAVADLYRRLQGKRDYLPNYAGIFCHRPEVMEPLSVLQETLKQHMEPRLWALVSLAVAREINSSYCSLAFAKRLLRAHFSAVELLAIVSEGPCAALQETERTAMVFGAKLARDAASIEQSDINGLREQGYSDPEIFDIVACAAWRCFFSRMPEALGARPDRALGQLPAPLLERLLVGRAIEV
jgi:alkylhydroperoxidase family enzyme